MASNNKTIAKNAIFLYIRMIVTVAISFYTARVLLQELGVDNYGIYNLVGGIVSLFASLKGMFSCAVQRYLNYEYAREDGDAAKVFSLSLIIHILVAVFFACIVEIVGYFMLLGLNIPPDRLFAAKVVFQFSVLASVVSIITIPYDAVIVAREKMNMYAYISLFEAFGRLLIVFILPFLLYDVLVCYGCLVLLLSLVVCSIHYWYCVSHFVEAQFTRVWDKKLFRELLNFAGWNFAGNLAFSLTNEGINMLLNLFGGVAVNAARGITYQIKNIVQQLLGNIMTAYRPQSTVKYAQKQYDKFYLLMFQSSKLVFALYAVMAFPLFIFLPEILQLWLGQIPEYTVSLMRAILVYMLIRSFHEPMDLLFKSAGQLKYYQLCELLILSLSLPLAYILLKSGLDFYMVFIGMAAVELVDLCAIVTIATRQLNFPYLKYIRNVPLRCFALTAALIMIHWCLNFFVVPPDNILILLAYCITDVAIVAMFVYMLLLNSAEKEMVHRIITKLLHKR